MDIVPLNVYKKLLKHFGNQEWWPAETKFEVIVGAILTQRTNWKNVEKAIQHLKEAHKLNIDSLATEEKGYIENLIRPSGFYKQKAERLILFSRHLHQNYSGSLHNFFKKSTEEMRRELLSLKGIGFETADSILLYAADRLILPVDAYTFRVFKLLGVEANSYSGMQKYLMDELPRDLDIYKEFHALIVKIGKAYCKKNSLCNLCPLTNECKGTSGDIR